MKLVLTSYYGDIDSQTLDKFINDEDDLDILLSAFDDGPDYLFNMNDMEDAVRVVERLKNSSDSLTIQGPNVKYVFKLVEIPDDVTDIVFDDDYGDDWHEEYLYYVKDGKITRVNGYYQM